MGRETVSSKGPQVHRGETQPAAREMKAVSSHVRRSRPAALCVLILRAVGICPELYNEKVAAMQRFG